MNQNMKEIREMQNYLEIRERPQTLFKQEYGCTCGFDGWLEVYRKELEQQCQQKLVRELEAIRGVELFKQKFGQFEKFQG